MKAAKYKAEFVPHFMAHLGLTDVNKVPARSTLQDVYQAHKRKQTDVAVEPAPPPRIKRARRAPKSRDESSSDDDALPSDGALEAMTVNQLTLLMARRGVARAAQDRKEDYIEKLKAHAAGARNGR